MNNKTINQQLVKDIIKIVKNENGKPIPPEIIFMKLKKVHKDKFLVLRYIESLVNENSLKRLNSGKIVMGYENGPILYDTAFSGTISINTKGDGFVTKDGDQSASVYVNRKNVHGSLNGDSVVVCLMDKSSANKVSDLKDGVVIKVTERAKDFFVATFNKKNSDPKGYEIVFDDEKNKLNLILDDTSGLVHGHKVLIKIKKIIENDAYGTVSKIIGHQNSVGTDILSMVYDAGLEPEFSDDVINDSKRFSNIIDECEYQKRKDLRHLNIITIDPATSKDLDDAIYVEKLNDNKFRLYVCIADVAHYVRPNSIVNDDALNRGNSVYLVNKVIPMLPHNLSNDICSLNPNEDRLSMVCEMIINKNGDFEDIKVYEGIINSKRRFSYDDVNDYLAKTNELKDDSNEIKIMIHESVMLFAILKEKREKLGYINFEIPEPKIILDENEKIIDIQQKKSGIAQNMIECFMVAANEAVTIYFNKFKDKMNSKFIYRIHNKPDERKIVNFKKEAYKLNFKFDAEIENLKPNTISKWLKINSDNPNRELINIILLRTMAKAEYSTTNVSHFGLAIDNYTHFTSPIRRYADLIVHRLYKMYIINPNEYTNAEKNDLQLQMDEICKHITKTEIVATNTERDVNSMKFAEYMESKVGYEYNGFVSYITSFGLFIQLENTIEGLARPENINGDFFEYNEENSTYIGKKTRKILSLGTKVKIKVIGASKLTRKIDFNVISIF